MTSARHQILATTGVLILLGTICFVASDVDNATCADQIASEAEEVKELSDQVDDLQLHGLGDREVALIHGHCFDEWLQTIPCGALVNHSWRWCSRGPPVA